MGELKDRRARKKAQTRQLIRSVAQRLFDEHGFDTVTIADVARESDVAVQTVFNHFATKEDLFFDQRTPWVEALGDAVRQREDGVAPLSALRTYLVETVGERVGSLSCPDRRSYIATLEASDALRARERELVHESELNLRQALLDAWASPDGPAPLDPPSAAPVIAAIWVAAVRSLIHAQRPHVTGGADPEGAAAAARALADRVLRQLELGARAVHGQPTTPAAQAPAAREDTGWPQAMRRAG